MAEGKKIAAIRVRGALRMNTKIEDTLKMLRLYRKNYCAVVPNDLNHVGMLKKAKDYITWGEIDNDTFDLLVEKRGEEFRGKIEDSKKLIQYKDFVVVNNRKIRKFFRLNSPRKGFGRKGIKFNFKDGGSLGYRGDKINDLIKRMV